MEPLPPNETVHLAEKVWFWQEQDRINRALIPRVLRMHDLLVELAGRIDGLSEELARLESDVAGKARDDVEAVRAELQAGLDDLRAELEQERGRHEALAAASTERDLSEAVHRLEKRVGRQGIGLLVLALLAAAALVTGVLL